MLSVTGIYWLSVAFAILQPIHTIQVAPDATLSKEANNTESEEITYSYNETLVGDSELSASERNRRLIPYMAFYLPAPDFPVNQQYLPTHQPHAGIKSQHDASAGPLPPPVAIPIPTAYVHMKLPAAATATTLQYQQKHQQKHRQQFPHTTGEVYHSIAYGGQHPLPAGFKEGAGAKEVPILHLLAPGTSESLAHSVPTQYKEAIDTHHKSLVYHAHTATHQQHDTQQQQYRQHPKQSKINLTPFTSSNTVPGHFIPIIYTPLSSTKEDDSIHYKSNPEPTDEHRQFQQELQQHRQQQQQKQQQQQQQKQQQIVHHATQYSLPPSASSSSSVGQQHHPPMQHQVQFLTVTPTASTTTGIHPTLSPIYRVINEQLSDSLKHQQQHPFDTHSNNPQFQPPKPENFFDNEQYRNAENMTPQQKYVLYLQQRMRYNKQQQQKLPERTKDRQRQHQQYFKYQSEQQHPQIFVISSTAAPVQEVGDGFMQLREPLQQQHHQNQQPIKYPQHSPVGHAVYPRPELPVPANHQTQPQQVLHIPVDPEFVQQYPRTHSGSQRQQSSSRTPATQHFVEQYQKGGSPVPPQYIDYIIEEPKQSLEDEHQQQQQQEQLQYRPYSEQSPKQTHSHVESQPAYIIITTAAPYPSQAPPREPNTKPRRPLYKNQPNLQLKPVHQLTNHSPPNYVIARPTKAPSESVSISPQYIYPPRPQKLRPTYDYDENVVVQPAKNYSPTAPMPPTAPPAIDTELYRPPITPAYKQQPPIVDPNPLPDIRSSSLADILHKLQASNHLPKTLTPDNIDNSIKTLITILNNLKRSQTIVASPPQHHEKPHTASSPDYDYTTGSEENVGEEQDIGALAPIGPTIRPGPNTGKPGVDYPNYAQIPATSFSCADQRYKGFFGDPETNCQVWHYCDLNGGKASFLCPNGTIFSQIALTCDWWFNVKCSTTSQLYVLNERLYKYILPFNPKFPEDYSGPIVDKYLALKFQEMEEKMRQEKQKAAEAAAAAAEADAAAAVEEEQSNDTETDTSTIEVETTTPPTTLSSPPQEHHSINSQVGEQSSERNLLIDDEVDDISQRGSVNEDGSSTALTSAAKEDNQPLSKKPIVVTSTSEQELESKNIEPTYESSAEYVKMAHQKTPNARETTKISVEKVEVIELKPEGLSKILSPAMIFSTKEKDS